MDPRGFPVSPDPGMTHTKCCMGMAQDTKIGSSSRSCGTTYLPRPGMEELRSSSMCMTRWIFKKIIITGRKYINNFLQNFVTHIVVGPAGSKKYFLTKTSLQPQNTSTKFQAITPKHRSHLLIQKKSLMFYHVQNNICFPVSPAPIRGKWDTQ